MDSEEPKRVIHECFRNTHLLGSRLALAARSIVYGKQVLYSSPLFREATIELQPDGSTAMRLWLDHGEVLTSRGNPATGFELAAADGRYVAANARVEGDTVLVSTRSVPKPVYVRFGWMGVVENNLFNAQGLQILKATQIGPDCKANSRFDETSSFCGFLLVWIIDPVCVLREHAFGCTGFHFADCP